MAQLRREYRSKTTPVVISGCVGPRGDGYDPGTVMSADEAQAYHAEQIGVFAETDADMVTAITMTNANEAIGLTRAAQAAGMPVAIAFTLETDGRLPTGQGLRQAIEEVDAATGSGPAYYMINCAHPTHFEATLDTRGAWVETHSRHPRQCVQAQPRRAQRGARPRRGQSGGARRPVPRPPAAASADQRAGRLLRHRPPPRRGDLRGVQAGGLSEPVNSAQWTGAGRACPCAGRSRAARSRATAS